MIEPLRGLFLGTNAEMQALAPAQVPQGVVFVVTDTNPRHIYINSGAGGGWTLLI